MRVTSVFDSPVTTGPNAIIFSHFQKTSVATWATKCLHKAALGWWMPFRVIAVRSVLFPTKTRTISDISSVLLSNGAKFGTIALNLQTETTLAQVRDQLQQKKILNKAMDFSQNDLYHCKHSIIKINWRRSTDCRLSAFLFPDVPKCSVYLFSILKGQILCVVFREFNSLSLFYFKVGGGNNCYGCMGFFNSSIVDGSDVSLPLLVWKPQSFFVSSPLFKISKYVSHKVTRVQFD